MQLEQEMNNPIVRLQANLNMETDQDIIKHFRNVQREQTALTSQAAVIRYILQRDMEVARVYGAAWDWRVVVKTPVWMQRLLDAVKEFGGHARLEVVSEDNSKRVEIGEGMFDE